MYGLVALLIWEARPTPATLLLGLIPVALGEALRLWATGHLHKNDALTVTGPYAYLRHPLYLGSFLIGLGFIWMARSTAALWIFGAFLCGYFAYYLPYKDRIEGARLEELYGDAFRRYSVAVPRLVPRLYPYVPLEAERGSQRSWNRTRFVDNNELGTALAVGFGVAALVGRWLLL